jgi:hypothetical protein
MPRQLTEHDGRIALRDHIRDRAGAARRRHGPSIDDATILRVLDDREAVRYPVRIQFDAGVLQPGEFAVALQLGEHPREGYCLFIHPCLEPRRDLWPLVIAYHIPPVNYGDIADAEDCELFGACLLGMHVEAYYHALCKIADSIPTDAIPEERGAAGKRPGHGSEPSGAS